MGGEPRLEEQFRKVEEIAQQKRQVLRDLIEKQCGLRQAVGRYLSLSREADLVSLRTLYQTGKRSEELLIAQHLVALVGRLARKERCVRAEVLSRVTGELALIRAQNALPAPMSSSLLGT